MEASNISKKIQSNEITGVLGDTTLIDLCTMLQYKQGCLEVTHGARTGKIFFDKGGVTHAIVEDMQGAEAFEEIFIWKQGKFAFHKGARSAFTSLHGLDLMPLMMETTLYQDLVNDLRGRGMREDSLLGLSDLDFPERLNENMAAVRIWYALNEEPQTCHELITGLRLEGYQKGHVVRALVDLTQSGIINIDNTAAVMPPFAEVPATTLHKPTGRSTVTRVPMPDLPVSGSALKIPLAATPPNSKEGAPEVGGRSATAGLPPSVPKPRPMVQGAISSSKSSPAWRWPAVGAGAFLLAAGMSYVAFSGGDALNDVDSIKPARSASSPPVSVATVPDSDSTNSAPPADAGAGGRIADPTDSAAMKALIGERVTVRGVIMVTEMSKSQSVRRLGFGTSGERDSFKLIIFQDDSTKFSQNGDPLEWFKGKRVEAKGVVEDYRGSPQIVLRSQDQIRVLD
jgi:hypothetical protein